MQKKIIGITGGIGAGKSTVCRIFEILGIPIYEADLRAKWLMQHDETLKNAIQLQFGEKSYYPDGSLNRTYLAEQVFHDQTKVQILNQLVHPKVGEDFQHWIQTQEAPYLLNEAALMFESGRFQMLDNVITVFAPEAIRIARVLKRDPQRSLAEVKGIIQKQISEEEKIRRSDFVIYNDDQQLLIPQVLAIHQKIIDSE